MAGTASRPPEITSNVRGTLEVQAAIDVHRLAGQVRGLGRSEEDGRAGARTGERDRPPDAAAAAGDHDPPAREMSGDAHAHRRASRVRTSRRAAAATSVAATPKWAASASGSPDAPKRSRTPTIAIGTGQCTARASATAPPSPPITE